VRVDSVQLVVLAWLGRVAERLAREREILALGVGKGARRRRDQLLNFALVGLRLRIQRLTKHNNDLQSATGVNRRNII